MKFDEHIMYTIAEIVSFLPHLNARIADSDQLIADLCYDTRKILLGSRSLFFALKNVRDGHSYIEEAYHKGVKAFVISNNSIDISKYTDATFIIVEDTLHAMQQLASKRRSDCKKVIVVAITGSNGKTVVKEWLTQLLGNDYKVYQSPKSYNSQIGVALSLWNLSDEYDYAFIEAGISEPREMAVLEQMIQPQVGIFTNIGNAHASGFSSQQEKLQEKLQLFRQKGIDVIYPSVYRLDKYLSAEDYGLYAFGTHSSDWILVEGIQSSGPFSTKINVSTAAQREEFIVPFTDKGSIENILICITFLSYCGYQLADIAQRIAVLRSLEMRLQLKKGKKGCSIIDDSYSNDLASLQIALDFLMQQKQHETKTLVLSGMEGLDDKVATKLFDLLCRHPLSRIILVGEELSFLQNLTTPSRLFRTTQDLLEATTELDFTNQTILIKGSRFYHLEDLSRLLTEKTHETVLEINLKAIEYNLQRYRGLLPSGVKMMAMVKAFSYGSGSYEVANLLQYNKVDYLTVAFADEGVELRQNGITLPIMVLSPDEQVFEALVANRLEPEIYSFRILRAFIAFLARRGKMDFPVHIKIDTGMHRLGFMPQEIPELITELRQHKELRVASVFSHLAAASDPQHIVFTDQQVQNFQNAALRVEEAVGYHVIKHVLATSGIIHRPADHFDMVRLGIGLYGISTDGLLALDSVGTLKTTVTQIKLLKETESVGYDRKGQLQRDSRIATVKIGYADGYDRRFGNGVGQMSIRGQLVNTVGNICMDMCMLDVTDIEVFEEDEVVVFPDLVAAAKSIGTIPYELLVSISSRVKRVYFYS